MNQTLAPDPTPQRVAPAILPGRAVPRLAVRAIGKTYGGRRALDGVSFEVRENEFVALLGPSGAGKTTLIRCMAGLLEPDTGSVWVNGLDVAGLRGRARRHVALVFQQFNLVNRLSALDNVLAGRLGHVHPWRGWTRRFSRADRLLALESLDRVGLLAHASQRADTLSGGQQQRVAIARALTQQAEIIIADEPIASLDPSISSEILGLLRGICRDQGVSVICSLHQLHLAVSHADRLIGLVDGRVAVDLPAAEFDNSMADRLYSSVNTHFSGSTT
ncbi:MAG: phosphonate ABC transporter ATP-binding protein [Burkholderiales bacterium]